MKYNYLKIIFIFIIILNYILLNNIKDFVHLIKKIYLSYIKNDFQIESFYELFNQSIKKKTILIIEHNEYHHECLPGYTKYLIDLGYNIDILLRPIGINSFDLFKKNKKIRFLTFEHLIDIKTSSKNLSSVIKNYDFVILETTDEDKKQLYINLNLLNNSTYFIFWRLY